MEPTEEYKNCNHCNTELEYDAVNPFCDPCWFNAIHKGDVSTTMTMVRWITRQDEEN